MIEAVKELQESGKKISLAHFHNIDPLPKNTEEIFGRFRKIIVPELNLGQFVLYLRMNFQKFTFLQYNKIQGLPFMVRELVDKFNEILEEQ
jgi:2-oxoglutarate ferredoxin oxidoreductase subunit alpha